MRSVNEYHTQELDWPGQASFKYHGTVLRLANGQPVKSPGHQDAQFENRWTKAYNTSIRCQEIGNLKRDEQGACSTLQAKQLY